MQIHHVTFSKPKVARRRPQNSDGGFSLSRPLEQITVLEVADAVEGRKALFQCKEIRGTCALFDTEPPAWATTGVCAIHRTMLEAEQAMRRSLASVTLQDIAARARQTIPEQFRAQGADWFRERRKRRRPSRQTPEKKAPVQQKEDP